MAIVLAVAAAALVLVYSQTTTPSLNSSSGDVTVLVATRTIPQFTPGNQVVDGNMFREEHRRPRRRSPTAPSPTRTSSRAWWRETTSTRASS